MLGSVRPGVPVWRCGSESRAPGLAYVVFPGNVGAVDDLAKVAAMLSGREMTSRRALARAVPSQVSRCRKLCYFWWFVIMCWLLKVCC